MEGLETINKHEALLTKENKDHEVKRHQKNDQESRCRLRKGRVRAQQPAPAAHPSQGTALPQANRESEEVAESQPHVLKNRHPLVLFQLPAAWGALLNFLTGSRSLGAWPWSWAAELRASLLCGTGQVT